MRARGRRHPGPCALTHPDPPQPGHQRAPRGPLRPARHPATTRDPLPEAPPPVSPRPPGPSSDGRCRSPAPRAESSAGRRRPGERRAGGGACLLSAPEAPPPARPRQSRAPHLRGGTAPPSAASGASPPRRVRRGSGSCVRPPAPSLAGRSAVASGHRDPRPSTLDPAGRPRRGGGGGGARAPCPCGAAAAPWPGISGDFPRGERGGAGAGGREPGRAGGASPSPAASPRLAAPRPGPRSRAQPAGGSRRCPAAEFRGGFFISA